MTDDRPPPLTGWERIRNSSWFTYGGIGFALIASVLILNWNEYDSPWGKANQQWKLEHLQRTICK